MSVPLKTLFNPAQPAVPSSCRLERFDEMAATLLNGQATKQSEATVHAWLTGLRCQLDRLESDSFVIVIPKEIVPLSYQLAMLGIDHGPCLDADTISSIGTVTDSRPYLVGNTTFTPQRAFEIGSCGNGCCVTLEELLAIFRHATGQRGVQQVLAPGSEDALGGIPYLQPHQFERSDLRSTALDYPRPTALVARCAQRVFLPHHSFG